jgi:hypothetical protein
MQQANERALVLQGTGTNDLAMRMNFGSGSHYIFDDADDAHALEIESANDLNFNAGGPVQRMSILGSGHVGINIAPSSSSRLRIAGATELYTMYTQAYGTNSSKYGIYSQVVNQWFGNKLSSNSTVIYYLIIPAIYFYQLMV